MPGKTLSPCSPLGDPHGDDPLTKYFSPDALPFFLSDPFKSEDLFSTGRPPILEMSLDFKDSYLSNNSYQLLVYLVPTQEMTAWFERQSQLLRGYRKLLEMVWDTRDRTKLRSLIQKRALVTVYEMDQGSRREATPRITSVADPFLASLKQRKQADGPSRRSSHTGPHFHVE